MKKIISVFVIIILVNMSVACQGNSTSTVSPSTNITLPVMDYSTYVIEYIAIRNMDDDGRTISIDYYYDDFENVDNHVITLLADLPNRSPNGGIGPLTGRHNDGWIELTGQDDSTLTLNMYFFDDSTILGVMVNEGSTEYFFEDYYDTEISSILNNYYS
ncbi:hypothetical protein RJI07_07195 [Mycoplasmatota bacterium WC30]